MNRKFALLPIIALVLLFALIWSRASSSKDSTSITISGNIEITEVEVSFQIPGKVEKRLIAEGDIVHEGDTIAILDNREVTHELALQEAELEAAKAKLMELQGGFRTEEVMQAHAKLAQAQANLSRLKADFSRQKQLFEGDVISSKEFDVSSSAYEVAKAKVSEARERYALLKKGVREEKILQAKAQVKKAEQSLALAQTKYDDATIRAPITGVVLSENVETGEFVAPGTPVVTLGKLTETWMRGYIDQTDLGKVKIGQEVEVTIDTYPGKVYPGTITFISSEAEFTPKNVQTQKERVKLVYRIKVDIPNPKSELKPGMPADGKILLSTSN